MRHCHSHFFHKIRFSLFLALFLIGFGIFCAAVCQCADSDTWIAQFFHESPTAIQAGEQNSNSAAGQSTSNDVNTDFENYIAELFRHEASASLLNLHYTRENPQAYQITEYQTSLGNYSAASPALAAASAENVLSALHQFDAQNLTTLNRQTLEILTDSMNLTVAGGNFKYYDEPLTPTTGLQSQIPILLAEYTFQSKQDVSDYLELLTDLPRYFAQICDYEREKAAADRFMPSYTAQTIIDQCRDFVSNPEEHYLVTTFNQKISALSGISKNERRSYQKQNLSILKKQVFPAFTQLADTLSELEDSTINEAGLCHFPEGREYYEYLVRCATGSSDSVASLEKRTTDQRKEDLLLISQLLEQNPDLTTELENCAVAPQSPEEMLTTLRQAISAEFPEVPECNVTVKYVDAAMEDYLSPAFYLTSPLDHLTENSIYINQKNGYEGLRLFTTLAHEGFPGHLFQNVYFHSICDLPIRSLLGYPGYTEGWATFVELHSYTYAGLSEDAASLCAANQAAILSLYATADMGIHYEGWTLDDTATFFGTYGFTDEETIRDIFELIVGEPANYLKYYIGYLEFHDLQADMKKQNPDTYTDSDFYKKVLDIGPAPFGVLREYVLGDQ